MSNNDDIVIDGKPVRSDYVSGSYYQIVKLDLGGDGLTDPVVGSLPVSVVDGDAHGTLGEAPPAEGVLMAATNGASLVALKVDGDGSLCVSAPSTVTVSPEGGASFNTVTDDLNAATTLLISQAYSSTQISDDQTNVRWRGARLFLNVTAAPTSTSETLTVSIQEKDSASGAYFTISKFTALPAANSGSFASAASFLFELYPSAVSPTLTNYQVQSTSLPYKWRATVTHSGASPWTYSLGACLIK
jgi:hypothetical protein